MMQVTERSNMAPLEMFVARVCTCHSGMPLGKQMWAWMGRIKNWGDRCILIYRRWRLLPEISVKVAWSGIIFLPPDVANIADLPWTPKDCDRCSFSIAIPFCSITSYQSGTGLNPAAKYKTLPMNIYGFSGKKSWFDKIIKLKKNR